MYESIRHGWNAREKPSRAEVVLARTIRWVFIPKEAKKNPFAPSPELRKKLNVISPATALCVTPMTGAETQIFAPPEVQREPDGKRLLHHP
ncbi:hypothetical protein [Candidatus Methylacidithermus pantelleriae]|uniref:hypothetical protein n=1 Tax=Candidatus Methylacidithermus pantelleriae TaxID=2744239 RepID=UPI00157C91DE|nr:hypothetical protein [Candidatus Methylacidithermus pantelleriae]